MRDSCVERLRIPPQSIQAEQAVLGGLMLSPDAWAQVSDVLEEADFYRRDHQLIFRAIKTLADKSKPYDAVTLSEWFDANGFSEIVAGGAYLIELASTTPSAANIRAYADIVSDKATLRKLIDIGTTAVNYGFKPEGRDALELVAELSQAVGDIIPKQRGGFIDARSAAAQWFEQMQRRYEQNQRVTGIPTPWSEFNYATRGLQPATTYFFGGRPSMGKSVCANAIAASAALKGHNVALFSLEATAASIIDRMVSNIADIPYDWIKSPSSSGNTAHDEEVYWARIESALRQIKNAPLYIDDTFNISARQFEAKARRLHHKHSLKCIVVDHVHDFRINPDRARFDIGEIIQTGKNLAKEWDIPVVFFGQLNRNVANRTDKRPNMADLRESGEIEQKADVIVLLHREDYYEPQTHLRGIAEFIIAKGRDIEVGTKHLRHRFDRMRFEDHDGPLPETPSKQKFTGHRFNGYRD